MRTFEPLDSKIVVVDEASMVDSHICWLLLNAVPDDAKLILIGDPEQLPSVGAGNVLFEFLNCQRIPTVRLDVIYRQAGTNSIVTNAGLIQQGVTKLTFDDDFRFFDVHATEDFPASDKERGKKIQSETRDIVIEQFMSAVKSEGLDEVQVLCPFRKKGVIAGATELNKEIQQRLNPPSYGKPEIKRGDRIFRLGDKVIQTKNNRDIGIFNGDVGYIKRIDTAEDEIIISFNGSDVTIDSINSAVDRCLIDLGFVVPEELEKSPVSGAPSNPSPSQQAIADIEKMIDDNENPPSTPSYNKTTPVDEILKVMDAATARRVVFENGKYKGKTVGEVYETTKDNKGFSGKLRWFADNYRSNNILVAACLIVNN